jgi:hypothetical protein
LKPPADYERFVDAWTSYQGASNPGRRDERDLTLHLCLEAARDVARRPIGDSERARVEALLVETLADPAKRGSIDYAQALVALPALGAPRFRVHFARALGELQSGSETWALAALALAEAGDIATTRQAVIDALALPSPSSDAALVAEHFPGPEIAAALIDALERAEPYFSHTLARAALVALGVHARRGSRKRAGRLIEHARSQLRASRASAIAALRGLLERGAPLGWFDQEGVNAHRKYWSDPLSAYMAALDGSDTLPDLAGLSPQDQAMAVTAIHTRLVNWIVGARAQRSDLKELPKGYLEALLDLDPPWARAALAELRVEATGPLAEALDALIAR